MSFHAIDPDSPRSCRTYPSQRSPNQCPHTLAWSHPDPRSLNHGKHCNHDHRSWRIAPLTRGCCQRLDQPLRPRLWRRPPGHEATSSSPSTICWWDRAETKQAHRVHQSHPQSTLKIRSTASAGFLAPSQPVRSRVHRRHETLFDYRPARVK